MTAVIALSETEPAVTVYTVPNCLDCAAVKKLLTEAGIPFREVDISRVPAARDALEMLSGMRTVPQVYVGGRYVGQVGEVRYLIQTGRWGAGAAGGPDGARGEDSGVAD